MTRLQPLARIRRSQSERPWLKTPVFSGLRSRPLGRQNLVHFEGLKGQEPYHDGERCREETRQGVARVPEPQDPGLRGMQQDGEQELDVDESRGAWRVAKLEPGESSEGKDVGKGQHGQR